MTRLDRFDRFEGRTYTVLALVFMYSVPLGGVMAAFFFLPRHLSWWIQIPLIACAGLVGVFLAFLIIEPLGSPLVSFFGYIRRRTGRKPLEEIERTIRDEQEEAASKQEERAKAWFVNLGRDEQLRSLFLMHKEALDYIKLISSLLQYVLIALVCIGVFLLAARFFRW